MKRFISLLLAASMLLLLVSCGSLAEESVCSAVVGGDSSSSAISDTAVSTTAVFTDTTSTSASTTAAASSATGLPPTIKAPTTKTTTTKVTTTSATVATPTPAVTTEQTTTEVVTTTKPTEAEPFDYLALGNSITQHGICDYWWNNIGMAASKPEKDYFHLVTSYLEQRHQAVNAKAVNFSAWEKLSTDRTQTIGGLDSYLSDKLDLITIQLSENVTDCSTFVVDMKELITILQQRCPKATIILVDDFWSDEKALLKEQIAADKQIPFASLAGIRGGVPYVCGMGAIVYDRFNNPHVVQHSGVAAHPGDKGMQAIADAIIRCLAQE